MNKIHVSHPHHYTRSRGRSAEWRRRRQRGAKPLARCGVRDGVRPSLPRPHPLRGSLLVLEARASAPLLITARALRHCRRQYGAEILCCWCGAAIEGRGSGWAIVQGEGELNVFFQIYTCLSLYRFCVTFQKWKCDNAVCIKNILYTQGLSRHQFKQNTSYFVYILQVAQQQLLSLPYN